MFGISLKKKMTFLRKDKVLAHGKTNFWWSSKIEMLQLWSKLSYPLKLKDLFIFIVNHDMQKLSL